MGEPSSVFYSPLAEIDGCSGKRLRVIMKNDREFVGTLRGFDDYVSLLPFFSLFFFLLFFFPHFLFYADIVLDDVTE